MERGLSAREAIIESGKTRLNPILMTTITMITGMLPTDLAMTEGSGTRVSMAWVLIGGFADFNCGYLVDYSDHLSVFSKPSG